jgi:hypothetical protein
MPLPKGFEGLSIDASSPAPGYDSGAATQLASALPPARHAGGVTGEVLVIKVV